MTADLASFHTALWLSVSRIRQRNRTQRAELSWPVADFTADHVFIQSDSPQIHVSDELKWPHYTKRSRLKTCLRNLFFHYQWSVSVQHFQNVLFSHFRGAMLLVYNNHIIDSISLFIAQLSDSGQSGVCPAVSEVRLGCSSFSHQEIRHQHGAVPHG